MRYRDLSARLLAAKLGLRRWVSRSDSDCTHWRFGSGLNFVNGLERGRSVRKPSTSGSKTRFTLSTLTLQMTAKTSKQNIVELALRDANMKIRGPTVDKSIVLPLISREYYWFSRFLKLRCFDDMNVYEKELDRIVAKLKRLVGAI